MGAQAAVVVALLGLLGPLHVLVPARVWAAMNNRQDQSTPVDAEKKGGIPPCQYGNANPVGGAIGIMYGATG